jgi:hypothetical protein
MHPPHFSLTLPTKTRNLFATNYEQRLRQRAPSAYYLLAPPFPPAAHDPSNVVHFLGHGLVVRLDRPLQARLRIEQSEVDVGIHLEELHVSVERLVGRPLGSEGLAWSLRILVVPKAIRLAHIRSDQIV